MPLWRMKPVPEIEMEDMSGYIIQLFLGNGKPQQAFQRLRHSALV
jgi:hypothetical protein